MRKHSIKPLFIAVPLLLASLIPQNSKNENVKAANLYPKSSLTTTINLNDNTESEVRTYYADLNGLDASERKGDNLLKNLKPILSENQKYYKYDNDNGIWQMYEIIDRDWEKSPASSTTYGTYDATTNTITNYEYGSLSNKKNNPYLHALYVNRSIDTPKTAWDTHTGRSNAACIEREHIWPKSHGFDDEEVPGARGDPMHLWAADGYSNGIHNNYFYGYVDTTRDYDNTHDKYDFAGNNLFGYPKSFSESNSKVFEPQDCDKGDIARACFYMVARYNNIAGNDDTIGSANPNLYLSNDVSKSEETGTSTPTTPFCLGILKDLLEWNKLDPVDEFEIHRNNLLFNNYTNNRNPFIDYPEWADVIWGDDDTKVANPSSDELYKGGTYEPPVEPTEPTDPTEPTEPTEPEKPKNPFIDENGLYFGILKPLYFYIIVAVVVVILLVIVIAASKNMSKKDKRKLKNAAKKAIKKSKGKR